MTTTRRRLSLGDYIAIAIAPALIMALIVSLVFFLLEVVYAGHYVFRLQWLFLLFVFAAVLIARISMESAIADRAGVYGLALAIVTFLTLQSLVEYPPDSPLQSIRWAINLGLMAIIWWCAHRLTWDCTFVDEGSDPSGVGLLDVAAAKAGTAPSAEPAVKPNRKKKRRAQEPSGLAAWWTRYRQYQESRRRAPRTLGVWVIYFSLAALPLFGLGQSLIPASDLERRRYAFWLMAIYVASGAGLLLTTTFLGLRRYLRERNLRMPLATASVWLTTGLLMIAALLLAAAILPRPYAEYQMIPWSPFAGNRSDRSASRWSFFDDAATTKRDQHSASGKDGQKADPHNQNPEQKKGNAGDRSKQQADKPGGGQGQNSSSSGGSSAKGDKNNTSGSSGGQKDGDKSGSRRGADDNATSGSSRTAQELFASVAKLLKWIVAGIVAVLVILVLFRSILQFLANFTLWARALLNLLQNWWQVLFGWTATERHSENSLPHEEITPAPPPFRLFMNPFASGVNRTPEEIIRYSFDALEAWARQEERPRHPEETPLEFSNRLGEASPGMGRAIHGLVGLYVRSAYAGERIQHSNLEAIRDFWDQLERHASSVEAESPAV